MYFLILPERTELLAALLNVISLTYESSVVWKGHRCQLDGDPSGSIWFTSSKKIIIIIDYDPENKINIHQSMLR